MANIMAAWLDLALQNQGDDQAQQDRFGKTPTPTTAIPALPPPVPAGMLSTAMGNVLTSWGTAIDLGNQEAVQVQMGRFSKLATALNAALIAAPPRIPPASATALRNILNSWADLDLQNLMAEQEQAQRFAKLATPVNAASIAPPPSVAPNASMANILAQWAQLPPQQVPRFIADLLSSSNPTVVAIGYAIMGITGQASHANEVDGIARGIMGFTGQPSHANEVTKILKAVIGFTGQASHANEVDIIGHASMGFTGQPSHLNEVIAIGHAVLGFTGRNVTVLGASVVSIAMVVMGIAGHNVNAGQFAQALERAWLCIQNLYKSSGASGGY
jgi:hypothetical protein